MSNFKKLPGSKVVFSISITDEDLKKTKPAAIEYFRKNINIKGFRKGRVPDEIIIKNIDSKVFLTETASRAINKKYVAFLDANKLSPLSPPKLSNFDPEKLPCEISVEVEVYPEITLGDYKKLKPKITKISVTKKEIDDVIETLITQKGGGVEVTRGAKNGDEVEVDFSGKDADGKVIDKTEGKNMKVRLGFGHFIEEFEKAILGMKPGEKKEGVLVKFPDDYPIKNLTGKRIPFDFTCHQVAEISVKNLDDDMAEKIAGKKTTVANLRKDIEELVKDNKERSEKKKSMDDYQAKIADITKIDLPESWISAEVNGKMERFKSSPEYRADPVSYMNQMGKNESEIKSMFEAQSKNEFKALLGLTKIVDKENIELNKDEIDRAKRIIEDRLKQNNSINFDSELRKVLIDMRIDKYVSGLNI